MLAMPNHLGKLWKGDHPIIICLAPQELHISLCSLLRFTRISNEAYRRIFINNNNADLYKGINERSFPRKISSPEHRYLTDLELRLHLAAEDIDAALEIDSGRALQRIPAAVQEVAHVRVRAMHFASRSKLQTEDRGQ